MGIPFRVYAGIPHCPLCDTCVPIIAVIVRKRWHVLPFSRAHWLHRSADAVRK